MIITNYKTVDEYYKNNIVWGYINSNTGELIFYSPSISNKIEKNLINNKKFVNIELLDTVIFLDGKYTQKIRNKTGGVFRETINNLSYCNVIKQTVYLNKKTNIWDLYNYKNHVGLLVDLSIENINSYQNLITNIILEHKNSNFNGISSDNMIHIHYNNTNINEIQNLNKMFITNKTLYKNIQKGFIELINIIKKNHYENENITIYVLSNNKNIAQLESISNDFKYNSKIVSMKNVIFINIDQINLNDLEQIYM
jgi:hypothetical protein